MPQKRKRYTPAPKIPPELQPLYLAILEVIAGKTSVTEAARRLGMARNHFQTMMHRGLSGLTQSLTHRTPGRVPVPKREADLGKENERLLHENEKLQRRVDTIDRLLGVASDLLKGRQLRARKRKTASATGSSGAASDDDTDLRNLLDGARELQDLGLTMDLAAAVVGASEPTLRRWLQRQRRGQPLRRKRGPAGAATPEPQTVKLVRDFVRETWGLVGAEAMRHCLPVSRRQALRIKKEEIKAMELDRLQKTVRITVSVPGVVRGSDAMYLHALDGPCLLFACADAGVPYRTSLHFFERYDGLSVADALDRDFTENGAPLVWRCDRASSHHTAAVSEVLDAHKVLLLHGPPYYPQYYGQLERQNREHRAWLEALGCLTWEQLRSDLPRMRSVLNTRWPRATLGWKTPAESWKERPFLTVDRDDLHDDVHDRAQRLRRHLDVEPTTHDLAERLAIEQALAQRGFLTREVGGWR